MVLRDSLIQTATVGMVPLQSEEAVNAMFDSLLGEIIQFALMLIVIVLSIGSLFLFAAAGIALMSQDSSRQNNVSTYVVAGIGVLAIAALVGVGPTVLQALGFETMQYIDPVEMVAGG